MSDIRLRAGELDDSFGSQQRHTGACRFDGARTVENDVAISPRRSSSLTWPAKKRVLELLMRYKMLPSDSQSLQMVS